MVACDVFGSVRKSLVSKSRPFRMNCENNQRSASPDRHSPHESPPSHRWTKQPPNEPNEPNDMRTRSGSSVGPRCRLPFGWTAGGSSSDLSNFVHSAPPGLKRRSTAPTLRVIPPYLLALSFLWSRPPSPRRCSPLSAAAILIAASRQCACANPAILSRPSPSWSRAERSSDTWFLPQKKLSFSSVIKKESKL